MEVNLRNIRASIALIQERVARHEFRMTIVPSLHKKEDIVDCAAMLGDHSLKIQNFNPRTTLDPSFANEKCYPPDDFAHLQNLVA